MIYYLSVPGSPVTKGSGWLSVDAAVVGCTPPQERVELHLRTRFQNHEALFCEEGSQKKTASEKKAHAESCVYVSPSEHLMFTDPVWGWTIHFWVWWMVYHRHGSTQGTGGLFSPYFCQPLQPAFLTYPGSSHSLLLSDQTPQPPCLCVMYSLDLEGLSGPFYTFNPYLCSLAHSASYCSGLSWGITCPGGPARFCSCLATPLPSSMAHACLTQEALTAYLMVGNRLFTCLSMSNLIHAYLVRVCQINEMKEANQMSSLLLECQIKAGKTSVEFPRAGEVG